MQTTNQDRMDATEIGVSRRHFLGMTVCAAGLAMASPSLALAQKTSAGARSEWEQVRDMFTFSEGSVPMNAANLCPSFGPVAEKVFAMTRDLNQDVSFTNRKKLAVLLEETRARVAEYLNVDHYDVALVRNTSEANCIINNGFPLGPKDQVLLWTENHATNNQAWDIRQKRYGFEIKRVSLPWKTPPSKKEVVAFFKKQIEPGKTKLFTFTEVSNVSGLKLPAKELCAMAHEHDIYVHVDGAQSWGALDLDLKDMDCDSFSASSHKWFCGPKETGILYVKKKYATQIWPNNFGYTGHIKVEMDLPDARRFETLGQRDDAAIAALLDAVKIHRTIGSQAVHNRVVFLADRLKQGLKKNGAKLVTPESAEFSHGVVIMEIPEKHSAKVVDMLYFNSGIAGAPTGGLRLCPHIYNTEAHVDRAIAGVKEAMSSVI
ncbi:MAG: aminotransferase class V-fold PLP-dependent enzyme [Desulfobacterales bacterium]|nr:aminotransferase class V-fold PLP-dependent enzyme [Desulfobacterales bacterium]